MPLHLRRFFPVLGRAATPSEPREGAFDHPATRNDFEALGGVGAFDDLQRPAPDLLQSTLQLGSGIAAIGEYMTQQRVVGRYGLQQVRRAVAILNIATMHGKANQEADGVGDDMTFAPFDPFAGVIASDPAAFSGFHALAVDHARRRVGRTPFGLARRSDEMAVQFLQQTVVTPVVEIAPNRRDRWKVVGQHPPLTPGRRDVEDRVEDVTQIGRARSANLLGRRHQRLDQRPLRIAHIACVSATAALISGAGEFGPGHRDLRSALQPNRITTC